jgi:hypothetical protein
MKRFLFGLIVLFNSISSPLFSQNLKYIYLKGTVLDKTTHEPVLSANIFLKKSSIGTFSNEIGEFDLALPDTLLNDTLALSSIGYKTYKVRISNLDLNKSHTFFLEQDEILLQEIVVSAKAQQAKEWVEKAFKKLSKNKPSKQYLLQAFYRELSLRDSTYVRLIEAAIEVQDFGYGSSLDRMKIKVLELRKSEDYITTGWIDKTRKLLFGEDNMLYQTIYSDFLRNYKANQKLAQADSRPFLDEYDFTMEEFAMFDSDSLAIIKFNSDETLPRPYYEGKLYINLSDFGIIRMEYGMVANPSMKILNQDDVFYQGRFFYKVTSDYREVDDKYYLSRVVFIRPQSFSAVENGKGKGQQYTVFDFAVNNIATNKSDFDRIKRKESQDKDIGLYGLDFKYNQSFWENYNMIKLNPLFKKAQSDLEKEKN